MQPRSLFRRFRLKLVTSSHACERGIAEVPKTANQVFGESDAMAANYDAEEVRPEHPHRPQLIAQHGMALGTSTWAPRHRPPRPSSVVHAATLAMQRSRIQQRVGLLRGVQVDGQQRVAVPPPARPPAQVDGQLSALSAAAQETAATAQDLEQQLSASEQVRPASLPAWLAHAGTASDAACP